LPKLPAQVFTVPVVPPATHYRIDAKLDAVAGDLAGRGSITIHNRHRILQEALWVR